MEYSDYLVGFPRPPYGSPNLAKEWKKTLRSRRKLWEVALRYASQYADEFEVDLYSLDGTPEDHPLAEYVESVHRQRDYLIMRGRLSPVSLNVFLSTPTATPDNPSPFFAFRFLAHGNICLECGDFADLDLRLNEEQAKELLRLFHEVDSRTELIRR